MVKQLATEVVVIGGGIMGASTALFLRQRGIQVVMLERDLCGSRSSGVNFGGVRRQGRSLAMLPLSQRAHQHWGRLTELIGTEAEYERSGHFKIARSQADMESLVRYAEKTRDCGLGL
jgi:sarcosine oxidase, subunit beta